MSEKKTKSKQYTPTAELVAELRRMDVMGVESRFLTFLLYWSNPFDALALYKVLDARSAKDKRLKFLWDYATSLRARAAVGPGRRGAKDAVCAVWDRYLAARTAVRQAIQEGNL